MTDISIRSVNTIYLKVRQRIARCCELESLLQGAVEVDESYFGAQCVINKRSRGAYGKTIVSGVLKRQGKAYTKSVPNCSRTTFQAIIRGHIAPDTIIHSDGWHGYDGLVDIGFDKYFRVHHSINEFASGERHINGIESFWVFAKRRLAKFNGVPIHTFYLHLKETEFRLIIVVIISTLQFLNHYVQTRFNFPRPKINYKPLICWDYRIIVKMMVIPEFNHLELNSYPKFNSL